jgi:hypothetical protein
MVGYQITISSLWQCTHLLGQEWVSNPKIFASTISDQPPRQNACPEFTRLSFAVRGMAGSVRNDCALQARTASAQRLRTPIASQTAIGHSAKGLRFSPQSL